MSQDITEALDGWDFDPHQLVVRIISGDDGEEKIQMRIDLGLLQMAINGRPDGQQPYGVESALDHFIVEAEEYGEGYTLSSEAIEELFREGLQYYHRYLCLFHLNYFELVVRDTERNLRMFEFVVDHAKKRRDQWRFDQYRPYVLMMNTRAKAMLALENETPSLAVDMIDEGCKRIRGFLSHYSRTEDECFELDFLERWGEEIRKVGKAVDPEPDHDKPVDPKSTKERRARTREADASVLRLQLRQAVEREEYERAAVIRDRLKRLEPNEGQSSS